MPTQSIGTRPSVSDARPISEAPTRLSAERSDVCPPWHSASQLSASRRVCMNGNVMAAELTIMKTEAEPRRTPRCVFLGASAAVVATLAPLAAAAYREDAVLKLALRE